MCFQCCLNERAKYNKFLNHKNNTFPLDKEITLLFALIYSIENKGVTYYNYILFIFVFIQDNTFFNLMLPEKCNIHGHVAL